MGWPSVSFRPDNHTASLNGQCTDLVGEVRLFQRDDIALNSKTMIIGTLQAIIHYIEQT